MKITMTVNNNFVLQRQSSMWDMSFPIKKTQSLIITADNEVERIMWVDLPMAGMHNYYVTFPYLFTLQIRIGFVASNEKLTVCVI